MSRGRQRPGWGLRWALGAVLLALPALAGATQVKIFQSSGAADFLSGELEGVSVDGQGRLRLAEAMELLARPEEPFLFTAIAHGDGWLLGTGSGGKVLRLGPGGELDVFFEAPESQVFALLADPDGTVFAGTSPSGKIYRIAADGSSHEVFFDPGETYIWALARGSDGRLLVATGTQGKLYAVGPGGKGEVLVDVEEPHLRSLAVAGDGSLLLGTAGEGLLLRWRPDGRMQTLYDAPQPEIVALTPGPDGSFYAAAVASEASQVDLSSSKSSSDSSSSSSSSSSDDSDDSKSESESSSSNDSSGFEGTGTRPSSFKGWRSELLKILPNGEVETLYGLQDETVYSLLWHEDRLWVGTGQDGELYSYRDGNMVLERKSDERQVVTVLAGAGGPVVATTNTAAVYRTVAGQDRSGSYLSRVLDAGAPARFGSFRWWGDVPAKSRLVVSVRSGLSARPDATWTPWSSPSADHEVPLAQLPVGRYVQWRAQMEGKREGSPRLDSVELSYRQRNTRPKIEDLMVLDPGQVFVPSNFNPGQQVFEPAHPDRQGIFTTLDGSSRTGDSRVKPLWKLGYRSLRWKVEDANQDELLYSLSFQPLQGPGSGEWLTVAKELEEEYYSFDATVLPDGAYRFRLVASDRRSNADGEALSAEQTTGPVVVDHTAPVLDGVRRQGGSLVAEVSDALNPIREAVVSTDAGEWKPVTAADGLVDGRKETLEVDAPAGARLLLLRLTDAANNVVTLDLMKELP